jgi:hypothetical protein
MNLIDRQKPWTWAKKSSNFAGLNRKREPAMTNLEALIKELAPSLIATGGETVMCSFLPDLEDVLDQYLPDDHPALDQLRAMGREEEGKFADEDHKPMTEAERLEFQKRVEKIGKRLRRTHPEMFHR